MLLVNDIPNMNIKEIKDQIVFFEKNIEKYQDEEVEHIIEVLNNDNRKSVQKFAFRLKKCKTKYLNEIERVKTLYNFDKSYGEYGSVVGVDEVGRGPLAGPIVAAAVILDLNYVNNSDLILSINDSKKLSIKIREELSEIIKKKALYYSIVEIDNNTIDSKGIGWCNNQVFMEAVEGLKIKPDMVLSDGYPIKNYENNNEAVIKGDTKSASIACASILAKVYRDNIMYKYDKKYPQYNFKNNVGYGTVVHVDAIKNHGICEIHRKSFLKNILNKAY